MSTTKNSLYFNYDGISSREFGLLHINTSGGMFEETLVASREIKETTVAGNDKPLFGGVSMSPRDFEMQIAFEEGFTDKDVNDVIMWLFRDNYKPLFFEDKPDKLFYCMPVSDSSLTHNGLKQGYITISMRCDSPYLFSSVYVSDKIDLTVNPDKYAINIENKGHFILYPEISIEKVGAGHITLTNTSNGGEIFEIRDLTDRENIYINNEKEIIETDIIGMYRYDNIIGNFLEIPYGRNVIEVQGNCLIQFRYQYKFKF